MAITKEGQQSMETKNKSITVKLKAGGSIVKIKPLFTHDSQFLIVASHCNLKVFSVSSGECFKTLKGHTSPVVSIQQNKKNRFQVLSCSEDGTVIRWDYASGIAVKTYNLRIKTPVSAFYAPLAEGSWFASTKIEDTDYHRLYCLILKGNRIVKKKVVLKHVHPHQKTIGFGVGGKFIAAVYGNTLHMYDNTAKTYKSHKTGKRELTCVACHPSEYVVATGDDTGRILVWADMLTSNHPTRSIYHWHTLPVADLAFSAEGSYVYSGGGESVLVKWNLNSENKHFLPRLGLPICLVTASPDNSFVATSHTDNAVQIISAQNQVVQIIQGFALNKTLNSFKGHTVAPTGLLYDPRTSSIVTNGRPGHLQFYKIHEDKQLFSLDIGGRNIVSQERNTMVVSLDVDKAALDHRGTWLATVEFRDDGETLPETQLKFWNFELTTQKFTLNTSVLFPHKKKINCIKFRPPPPIYIKSSDPPMAVTTSDDKNFKLWMLEEEEDDKDVPTWFCYSMGFYHDLCPGDASFCEDGSLLAVAFGYLAILWIPDSTEIKATLSQPRCQNNIKQLIFGRDKCSHFLVCNFGSLLTVWNVLTFTVTFNIRNDIQYIAGDLYSDVMVAFSADNCMFVFRPSSDKPIACFKNVSGTPIVSAIFVPKCHSSPDHDQASEDVWLQNSELYFLNENQELKTVCDEHEESDLNSEVEKEGPVKTIFSLMQAEHKKSEAKLEIDECMETADTCKMEFPLHGNSTTIDQFLETERTNWVLFDSLFKKDPVVLCERMISSSLVQWTKENEKKEHVKEERCVDKNSDSSSDDDDDESFTAKQGKSDVHRTCDVLPSETTEMDTEDRNSNEIVVADYTFIRQYFNPPEPDV